MKLTEKQREIREKAYLYSSEARYLIGQKCDGPAILIAIAIFIGCCFLAQLPFFQEDGALTILLMLGVPIFGYGASAITISWRRSVSQKYIEFCTKIVEKNDRLSLTF